MKEIHGKAYCLGVVVVVAMVSAATQLTYADTDSHSAPNLDEINASMRAVNSILSPATTCPANTCPKTNSFTNNNSSVSRNTSDPCTDLAALTCQSGSFDDGTAIATSDMVNQKFDELEKNTRRELATTFSARLQDPIFRNLALAVCGKGPRDPCKNCAPTDAGEVKNQCDTRILKNLVAISLHDILYSKTSEPPVYVDSLSDLDKLEMNESYKVLVKTTKTQLIAQFKDSEGENKVKETFLKVKTHIVEVLKHSVNNNAFEKLKNKIESIPFAGSDCTGFGKHGNVSSLFVPNAYYDSNVPEFKYCNGFFLNSKSDFQIASIIAHELGHSIDPCNFNLDENDEKRNLAARRSRTPSRSRHPDPEEPSTPNPPRTNEDLTREKEYPFPDLISCLRSEKSVGARINPEAKDPNNSLGALDCGDKDQIGESFSDWLAAEALPKYLATYPKPLTAEQYRIGYSNVHRGMCGYKPKTKEEMREARFNSHPYTQDRVNKIILANPKVRTQMGCKALSRDTQYCEVTKKDAQ